MLRIGIAGVGGLGTLHLRNLMKMTDLVRVEALADPIEDLRSGAKLTSDTNLELVDNSELTVADVRSYEDYSGVCTDPDLDVVCLATPSDLHAPGAIMALENGKHVFTEKPMALNRDDCGRMMVAAAANGRTLMVGQCLRFFPAYIAAKTIMQSGEFGKPLSATMNRASRQPGRWFADTARSGGVNLDLHIHDIDAALWWWGEPDSATSQTVAAENGVQSVLSTWAYTEGPIVQIEASWDAGIPFFAEFRIVLEEATLRCAGDKLEHFTKGEKKELELTGPGGHEAEMRYFINCLLEGKTVDECPPESSALAVQYALGSQG
jgi:predicted dehydrogenase